PATVTRTLLQPYILKRNDQHALPVPPPYDSQFAHEGRVSLVKDDSFQLRSKWNWSAEDVQQTLDGSWCLCLIGYVDYFDKFGRRHRAGYGRIHDPQLDNMNCE